MMQAFSTATLGMQHGITGVHVKFLAMDLSD